MKMKIANNLENAVKNMSSIEKREYMKNKQNKYLMLRGNKKEEKIKNIGLLFLLVFVYLLNKFIGLHGSLSYILMYFLSSYIFLEFIQSMIKNRKRKEQKVIYEKRKAMNLFLGSYKRAKLCATRSGQKSN